MQLHVTSLILGALLCIAGGVVLWWALWKDRAKGRLRCPKCWYTLEGLPVIGTAAESRRKCPECGHVACTPRSLQKTRRRWRWAMAAIGVLLLGFQVALAGTPGREGVWSLVPTLVLAAWTDDLDFNEPSVQMLASRIRSGIVLPWDRTVAGWIMLHRSRVDWEQVVAHRCRWPIGSPYLIQLNRPQSPWTIEEHGYIEMRWLDGEAEPAYLHCFGSGSGGCFFEDFPTVITLPAPKAGVNVYNVCVMMEGERGVTRTRRMSLVVEGVTSEREAMIPERDWLTQLIRDRLVWRIASSDEAVWAIVALENKGVFDTAHVNIAHECELQRDGQTLHREFGYEADMGVYDKWHLGSAASSSAGMHPTVSVESVVVVVSSAPAIAKQDLSCDRYWDGECRVSLRELPLLVDGRLWDVSACRSIPTRNIDLTQFTKSLREVLPSRTLPPELHQSSNSTRSGGN